MEVLIQDIWLVECLTNIGLFRALHIQNVFLKFCQSKTSWYYVSYFVKIKCITYYIAFQTYEERFSTA